MKIVLALAFAALALAATVTAQQKYTTKYDNVDLDEILNNQRLYKKYFDCLVGTSKCTPDGKELKDVLPDALATDCSKCNEKQKNGSEKVIKFIKEKKPGDFDKLEKLYDPNGTYRARYPDKVKKLGI